MNQMRYLSLLLLICFYAVPLPGQSDGVRSNLEQAQAAMQAEDYAAAIEGYEAVITAGYTSARLHQNLGSAYFRRGDIGRAILNFERGLRLAPQNGDLRYNLNFVRRQAEGLSPAYPGFFLYRWWQQLAGWMVPDGWAVFVLSCLWLALLAFLAWSTPRIQFRWGRAIAGSLLLVAFLGIGLALERRHQLERRDAAILLEANSTLRVAPGMDAPEAGTAVPVGLRVRLIDQYEDWRKVELENGRQGWLPEGDLGII